MNSAALESIFQAIFINFGVFFIIRIKLSIVRQADILVFFVCRSEICFTTSLSATSSTKCFDSTEMAAILFLFFSLLCLFGLEIFDVFTILAFFSFIFDDSLFENTFTQRMQSVKDAILLDLIGFHHFVLCVKAQRATRFLSFFFIFLFDVVVVKLRFKQ